MGDELPAPNGSVDVPAGGVDVVSSPLPIGEVLSLLQEEFPDVTISKIRFLESQGLIQPERTASGYRRFSSGDIDRLQWILHQQRDNFLPLKVIRRMIEEGIDRYDPAVGSQPTLFSSTVVGAADEVPEDEDDDEASVPHDSGSTGRADQPRPQRSSAHPAVASATPARHRDVPTRTSSTERPPRGDGPVDAVTASGTAPADSGRASTPQRADTEREVEAPTEPPSRQPHETPADVVAALQEDPRPGRRQGAAPVRPDRPLRRSTTDAVDADTRVGADELCRRSGIDLGLLSELERFGLVQSQIGRGGDRTYGRAAVEVARLAARYRELGVEPRHLRMYLVSAEREAGMVEQLAVPLLKQRNPNARQHASELASELVELGADLHRALLRRELGGDLLP